MAKIHQAIIGVMGDVGAIGKDKRNVTQGFQYRGVDDVMNALQPVMVKHGIFVVPEVLERVREERQTRNGGLLIYTILTMMYTFFAEDGSFVTAKVIGEGMDSADKSSNKAMSIAYKYACFQVFSIPTEEMRDPEGETPPESAPVKKPAAKSTAKAAPEAEAMPFPQESPAILCEDCGMPVVPYKKFSAEEIAENTRRSHGATLCWKCGINRMNQRGE